VNDSSDGWRHAAFPLSVFESDFCVRPSFSI
jgi:hypothetical protein